MSSTSSLDLSCVNAIRALSIDAVQKANSGHPGLPLGAAPMAFTLWHRHLRHSPQHPQWPDRDRFVLSAGHGSMLLYSLLHLTGYDLPIEQIEDFRQWESTTPGHPEFGMTPGVEATTGPLGQGSANVVGMAMAERWLANHFNRPGHEIVDHFTYALVSDGDLMEGISAEAASLAGHLRLGKLIYLYDANHITLDGPTALTFSREDVAKRYEAYGWQVLHVENGDDDLDGIDAAIAQAKADTERPSIIVINTTIGFGSPNKAGSEAAHGSPLGPDEVELTKKALGWNHPAFEFPGETLATLRSAVDRGNELQADWETRFGRYREAHPELAQQWHMAHRGELPANWNADVPSWPAGKGPATRAAGGEVLNALAKNIPWLIGGDADLSVSTKTKLKDEASFDGQTGAGRNIHFGVREHAMAAAANGMCYHGGVRPFTATFFCFSDYMRPSIRLAALSHLAPVHVWTHDSVGVGEDGPTHQPVEHMAALRAIPNLHVFRPADANETAEAWQWALQQTKHPVGMVLSRQSLPVLKRDHRDVARGAYVLSEAKGDKPDAIVIATGSEVHLAVEAQTTLAKDGVNVRVVSMPCMTLFESQDEAYRHEVLPPTVHARVSIEAQVTFGWDRWVGDRGVALGIDRFGASAPGGLVLEKLGMTASAVVNAVKQVIG